MQNLLKNLNKIGWLTSDDKRTICSAANIQSRSYNPLAKGRHFLKILFEKQVRVSRDVCR